MLAEVLAVYPVAKSRLFFDINASGAPDTISATNVTGSGGNAAVVVEVITASPTTLPAWASRARKIWAMVCPLYGRWKPRLLWTMAPPSA
jgi:hypothetical protein